MAGKIKAIIDEIIRQRSAANPMFAGMVKTKLILKGLDPSKFDATPTSAVARVESGDYA